MMAQLPITLVIACLITVKRHKAAMSEKSKHQLRYDTGISASDSGYADVVFVPAPALPTSIITGQATNGCTTITFTLISFI